MSAGAKPPRSRDPQSLNASAGALEEVRKHAETIYPEEACGALLGHIPDVGPIRIVEVIPADNVRQDERGRRYLIGPDDVLEAERRAERAGLEVVGYYHSHPDHPAVPSEFDREHAWPWYIYLIVSVKKGRAVRFGAWRLTDDRESFRPVPLGTDAPAGR